MEDYLSLFLNNRKAKDQFYEGLKSSYPQINIYVKDKAEAPFSNAIASIFLLLLEKVPKADEAEKWPGIKLQ